MSRSASTGDVDEPEIERVHGFADETLQDAIAELLLALIHDDVDAETALREYQIRAAEFAFLAADALAKDGRLDEVAEADRELLEHGREAMFYAAGVSGQRPSEQKLNTLQKHIEELEEAAAKKTPTTHASIFHNI